MMPGTERTLNDWLPRIGKALERIAKALENQVTTVSVAEPSTQGLEAAIARSLAEKDAGGEHGF